MGVVRHALVIAMICAIININLCEGLAVHPKKDVDATEFEKHAIRKEIVRALNQSAPFLATPGLLGFSLATMPKLQLDPTVQTPKSERDLELFDLTVRTRRSLDSLLASYGAKQKPGPNGFKPIYTIQLEDLQMLRPIIGIVPPLRIIDDAKEQFHYYAGSENMLTVQLLRKTMRNIGMAIDDSTATNMLRRIQVYDDCEDSHGVCLPLADRCEFVAAILAERGILNSESIESADEEYEKLREKAIEEGEKVTKTGIPLIYWIKESETAKNIFPPMYLLTEKLEGSGSDLPPLQRTANVLGWMYNIAGDEKSEILDKCEHRILYHFTAMSLESYKEDDEDVSQAGAKMRFDNNKVAAWLVEDFGKRELLGSTCKVVEQSMQRCLYIKGIANADIPTCSILGKAGDAAFGSCDLRTLLSRSQNIGSIQVPPIESTEMVPYSPLLNGLDALFYVFDNNGDFELDDGEFSDLMYAISLFGEMSMLSTVGDQSASRTTTGSPYFHSWFMTKGARYNSNLLRNVAKLSMSKLKQEGFKSFWKAIHFTNVYRTWDRFKPGAEHPLNQLEVQGLFNRIRGYNRQSVASRVIRDWHPTNLKFCQLKQLKKQPDLLYGITTLLLDEEDVKKITGEIPIKDLGDKFCKKIYNSKGMTCDCGAVYDDSAPGEEVCLCKDPTAKADLEQNDNNLTIMDILDSTLMGIPNYAQRVEPNDIKLLYRMLVGANDNFDEITPERWQIVAPILRAFSDLDSDYSGTLNQEEFRVFGRCTSYVMPRMRLASNVDMKILFNKIKAISQMHRIQDGKDTANILRDVPAEEMLLPEFALAFTEIPSENCLKAFCGKSSVDEKMMPWCLIQDDETAVKLFCIENRSNKKASDSASCKTLLAEFDSLAEVPRNQLLLNLRESTKNAVALKKCMSYGSISFESFLDSTFSNELSDSRTKLRIERCTREIRCKTTTTSANIAMRAGVFQTANGCDDV